MKNRICINCKYYNLPNHLSFVTCNRIKPRYKIDLVSGKEQKIDKELYCFNERDHPWFNLLACSKIGRYYEASNGTT